MRNPEESTIEIEQDMGFHVLSASTLLSQEVKDSATRDWPDEHGLDVYDADTAVLKDFDFEVKLGYKETDAAMCNEAFQSLVNWFLYYGTLHAVYSKYYDMGRQKVRFKGASDIEFYRTGGETLMTFKLKFNVADPDTEVGLGYFGI